MHLCWARPKRALPVLSVPRGKTLGVSAAVAAPRRARQRPDAQTGAGEGGARTHGLSGWLSSFCQPDAQPKQAGMPGCERVASRPQLVQWGQRSSQGVHSPSLASLKKPEIAGTGWLGVRQHHGGGRI